MPSKILTENENGENNSAEVFRRPATFLHSDFVLMPEDEIAAAVWLWVNLDGPVFSFSLAHVFSMVSFSRV